MAAERPDSDRRVLLLAPTSRDGDATRGVLNASGIACVTCLSLDHLCAEAATSAAAVVLPEELVLSDQSERLAGLLRRQPVWSDLPVIVLSRSGAESPAVARAVATLGNVSLVERPMRVSTLLSVIRAALRARERQYEVREHLENQRRAEAELAQTQRKLDSALIAGEVGTFEWDVVANRVQGDRNFARFFGVPAGPDGAGSLTDYVAAIHPDDRAGVVERVNRTVLTGCAYEAEYRIVSGERTRWVVARGTGERDDGGQVIRLPGVILDITDRKRAEETRRMIEFRWQRLVDQSPLSTQIFASNGSVRKVNRAFERLWGLKVADLADYDILHDRQLVERGVMPAILRAFSGEAATAEPIPYVLDRGEYAGQTRWCGAYVYPVKDDAGRIEEVVLVHNDVTERRIAEDALRESEERLRAIFDQTEAGIAHVDLSGRFVLTNERYAQIVGRSRGELLDLHMQDITHADDLPRNLSLLRTAVEDGNPFVIEKRYVRPDGSAVWVSNSVSVMRGRGGEPNGIIAASVDITERKRVEERLRTSEERLALSLSAAGLGTFYCPMPLGRIEWNDTCKAHFWLPPDAEVDFDLFYSVIHLDDRERTRQAVERAVYDREPYDIEYRTVAPDGRQRWIRARGRAYYDAAGAPIRFDGVTLDVTDRRQAVEALRDSEQRFRDMANTAPAMLWVTEPDGYCSFLSRGWYEFTGQTEQEGLGLGWTNAAHPDDREAVRTAFVAASRDRTYYEIDFRVRRADGEYRWVIDAGRPRFGPGGEFRGFIGSVIDITDRKVAEAERSGLLDRERAARTEAERASRMKDDFLATLSHELRTPLNAILGWSQILASGSRDAGDLTEGLRTIERNARAQTQIIEDLLDMSRIISGKIRLDVQRLDLPGVVQAAVDTMRPAADAKAIRLQAVIDPNVATVSGDPGRLHQVFWNLISNAIKFTPRGGRVQILLERVSSHLEVSVIDTGEGIRPEFLPSVFDRFKQADASTTRRHGGLGLGLSIVKQLVELHGGTVRAVSPGEGQGSTFIVALPLTPVHVEPDIRHQRRHPRAEAAPPAALDADCPKLKGVRVLVVDDEADSRDLVKRLLEDCEASVVTASSAAEAMEVVLRMRPDVLVSDIGMPGEDGYSLIRRVRALGPDRGGDVPAVALTAYARVEDRVRAVRAGFQTHVVKPVEPAELITMVASLTGRTD